MNWTTIPPLKLLPIFLCLFTSIGSVCGGPVSDGGGSGDNHNNHTNNNNNNAKSIIKNGKECLTLPGSHWKSTSEFGKLIEGLERISASASALALESPSATATANLNTSAIEASAILMRLHWEGKLPHLRPDWSKAAKTYWPLCKAHPDCRFIAAVMTENGFMDDGVGFGDGVGDDDDKASTPATTREAKAIALLKMASYSKHPGAQEALAYRLSSSKRGLKRDYKAARNLLLKVARRVLSELLTLSQSTNSGPFGHLMRGRMVPLHQSQRLFLEPLGSVGINIASSTSSLDDPSAGDSGLQSNQRKASSPESELKALMLLAGDRLPHAPSLTDLLQFFRWSQFSTARYALCLVTFLVKKFRLPEIEDSFTAEQLVSLGQFYQFGESSKDKKTFSFSETSSFGAGLFSSWSTSSSSAHGSRSPITSNNENEYSHSVSMAEKMYRKAILLGSPTAHGLLGLSMLRTTKDPSYAEALSHLRIASKAKSSYGHLGLGLCYAYGLSVPAADSATDVNGAAIVTDNNGSNSSNNNISKTTILIEKDEAEGLRLLKMAADAGLAQGHFEYAKLLQRTKSKEKDAIVNGFIMSLRGGMLVGAWELGNLFIPSDVLRPASGSEITKLSSPYERNSLTSLKLLQLIVDRCPTTLRKMDLASKAVRSSAKAEHRAANLWSALATYLEAASRGWPIAFSNAAWILEELKVIGYKGLDDRIVHMWLGAATRAVGPPRDVHYETTEMRSDVGALLRLGDIFYSKKNYRLSAAFYYRAIRLNGSPEAAFNLALMYDGIGIDDYNGVNGGTGGIDGVDGGTVNDDDGNATTTEKGFPKSPKMAEQLLRVAWSQSLQKEIGHLAWLPLSLVRMCKIPLIRRIYQKFSRLPDMSSVLLSLQVILAGITFFQWFRK